MRAAFGYYMFLKSKVSTGILKILVILIDKLFLIVNTIYTSYTHNLCLSSTKFIQSSVQTGSQIQIYRQAFQHGHGRPIGMLSDDKTIPTWQGEPSVCCPCGHPWEGAISILPTQPIYQIIPGCSAGKTKQKTEDNICLISFGFPSVGLYVQFKKVILK